MGSLIDFFENLGPFLLSSNCVGLEAQRRQCRKFHFPNCPAMFCSARDGEHVSIILTQLQIFKKSHRAQYIKQFHILFAKGLDFFSSVSYLLCDSPLKIQRPTTLSLLSSSYAASIEMLFNMLILFQEEFYGVCASFFPLSCP